MTAIEVEGLTRDFGHFRAVDNVTFHVEKAEILGFLGPNGAGKTTTIRMLCGILKPTAGRGHVAGLDIIKENEKIKSEIGYMSQRFTLYPDLTVDENIDFFTGIYRVQGARKTNRKAWALRTAGLTDHRHVLARELPGGFKQRLALVCGLMHRPSIVFLDEPTAGVDPISRREFWDLIYYLKTEEQTTVFVTTHYLDEAEHCERIALIQGGRIAALDSPSALKKSLATKVYFVQGEPIFEIKDVLEKSAGVKRIVPFGVALHLFLDDEKFAEAIKGRLASAGLRVERFEPLRPSLEDVFIALMET